MYTMLKSPTRPLEDGKYPGFRPGVVSHPAFDLHRDVAVPLRDGTTMYIDIYMPKDLSRPVPTLIGWSPYGKHGYKNLGMLPGADVEPEWISEFAIWEGPDPAYWCAKGYAIVSPDARGSWKSEGELTLLSPQEAQDGYDVIEWLAEQPWSNGKVGMLGVSYLAMSQYSIAATRPPHLAAICPWEGCSDIYREFNFHGGIPETTFSTWWRQNSRFSLQEAEDFVLMQEASPLYDEYWASKVADVSAIQVPTFVVASWTDQGCHTRGTLEAFRRIGSDAKWLLVHGDKKWKFFYHPDNVQRQQAFFDTYLKGIESGLGAWPRVELEVRETIGKSYTLKTETWPVEGTEYRTLFLDAASQRLASGQIMSPSSASYVSDDGEGRLTFDFPVSEDLAVVGYSKLKLWISTADAEEMDLFVALEKLDRDGNRVPIYFFNCFEEGPLALGWLRASQRELDPERSTFFQPFHKHAKRQPITPGEICPIEVEVWPSGTQFASGDTLRLVVQGRDVQVFGGGLIEIGHRGSNKGVHTIHTGDRFDSHLVIPTLPRAIWEQGQRR